MDKLKTNNYSGEMLKSVILVGLFSLLIVSFSFAQTATSVTALSGALSNLCKDVKGMLGIAMLLMIVVAALIYAAGQIMGAETRARATVWATAMFTGAIIAAVIYIVVPSVLKGLGFSASC